MCIVTSCKIIVKFLTPESGRKEFNTSNDRESNSNQDTQFCGQNTDLQKFVYSDLHMYVIHEQSHLIVLQVVTYSTLLCRLLKAFQFVEKHGEVCPANWVPESPTIKPSPKVHFFSLYKFLKVLLITIHTKLFIFLGVS